MGQGTENCDKPAEVSVIRFVSRNRTIEEIAPKQELYTCKQRGCGKVFTNQDEYRTHEALEALKIKFICREPGCGEELSDPGSMWRHYQEWHNNETYGFVCPYTSCGSLHSTSENLEEHVDSCHRQPLTLPIEPEVICLEGSDNVVDETSKNDENSCSEKHPNNQDSPNASKNNRNNGSLSSNKDSDHALIQRAPETERYSTEREEYSVKTESPRQCETSVEENLDFYDHMDEVRTDFPAKSTRSFDSAGNNESKFPRNEDLLITEENFLVNYESRSSKSGENMDVEKSHENNIVFANNEVTITSKCVTNEPLVDKYPQEHRIDLGNLEKVFRSGLECGESPMEHNSNCSENEEYMPKKQRMSRHKQESYKCDATGCGKMYKYVSHYRHHQDSHKLVITPVNAKPTKPPKPKSGKASTVSFFLCKMPGCGAEVNNVTSLWKHYQENHANAKPPIVPASRSMEIFRCKVPGCESEFSTNLSLYKHFNEVHNGNFNSNGNGKTGNGGNFCLGGELFHGEVTAQEINFKTDIEANHNINLNDRVQDDGERASKRTIDEESHDSFA